MRVHTSAAISAPMPMRRSQNFQRGCCSPRPPGRVPLRPPPFPPLPPRDEPGRVVPRAGVRALAAPTRAPVDLRVTCPPLRGAAPAERGVDERWADVPPADERWADDRGAGAGGGGVRLVAPPEARWELRCAASPSPGR